MNVGSPIIDQMKAEIDKGINSPNTQTRPSMGMDLEDLHPPSALFQRGFSNPVTIPNPMIRQ
jgi:hypothetical protein